MKNRSVLISRGFTFAFITLCLVVIFREELGLTYKHTAKIIDFKVEEVAQKAGLNFTHESTYQSYYKNIAPWLSSLSSSVAVVDIDGDDWPDIYLNTGIVGKPNALFRNNQDGTFTDVAEKYGLANINDDFYSVRSIFSDCDNDGSPELLQVKAGTMSLYKKGAGINKYSEVKNFVDQNIKDYANAVFVADLNRDGLLDIVVPITVGRGEGRIDPLPMNFVKSNNGAPTYVFENVGGCKFKLNNEWLKEKPIAFTNALGGGDLKNRNKTDLWFATDYNDDQVFFQKEDHSGYMRFPDAKNIQPLKVACPRSLVI